MNLRRTLQHQLDLSTKMSVLALLWKQGMTSYKAHDYSQSSGWLRLSLTRLLYIQHSENQDRGKSLELSKITTSSQEMPMLF